MYNNFKNAQEAFEFYYDLIMKSGEDRMGTKTLFNVGFELQYPDQRLIQTPWRKWNLEYAEYEWQWYMSANPSGVDIAKRAKIWQNLLDEKGHVNSNYGYQWQRENQLDKVVQMLIDDPLTRRASISLYDGKEINKYSKDTVCTYAINFYIVGEKLNMQVMMRSNDLVYGFCNDQYCFSKLQELVAKKLNKEIGNYFHFVCNMHIYEKHYTLKRIKK